MLLKPNLVFTDYDAANLRNPDPGNIFMFQHFLTNIQSCVILLSTVEAANSLALEGLERLERNFPILNQSTDQVCSALVTATHSKQNKQLFQASHRSFRSLFTFSHCVAHPKVSFRTWQENQFAKCFLVIRRIQDMTNQNSYCAKYSIYRLYFETPDKNSRACPLRLFVFSCVSCSSRQG